MKPWLFLSAAVAVTAAIVTAQAPAGSPLIRAMHDEIDRSRKLTVPNLETPYFIQYLVDEGETFSASATMGGLTSRRRDEFRSLDVNVRVGDYKFDNTNYTQSDFNFGTRYELGRFPIENSYDVLRRYLWLSTDTAYKSAVEAISRKRAALRNLTVSDQLNDFAHAEPVHILRDFQKLNLDETAWANRVRALSAIFGRYPEVQVSSVSFSAGEGGYYIVNSEGTEVRVPDRTTYIRARAVAQAPDGSRIRDAVVFQAAVAADMPNEAELTRGVENLARNMAAMVHAPRGEEYSGPVLFEGTAGAQVFAEVLGTNLALTRRPVSDGRRGSGSTPSELEGRLAARILPDTFDVVDDPTQTQFQGHKLFGAYEVDREGVVPKPLHLVEKGVLKGYLLTRQPVRGFEGSNGRARMPGQYGASTAGISNLFVKSSETMPAAQLRKEMLDLVSMREKPYGIIVRKMDFPSSASVDEIRRLVSSSQSGSSHPVSLPVLVYRVYPDGHEELMRGVRFRGFNARSLKDIVAVGDDLNTFEFLDNAAPFSMMDGAGYVANASVIAPSILVDDLELIPIEEELPRLPVVAPPDSTP